MALEERMVVFITLLLGSRRVMYLHKQTMAFLLLLTISLAAFSAQEADKSSDSLRHQVTKTEELLGQGKVVASTEAFENCLKLLTDSIGSASMKDTNEWKKIHGRLTSIHEKLVIEGSEPNEVPSWSELMKQRKKESAKTPATPDTVSFTRDIAPWMVQQCGKCHIEQTKGGLSIESFATLMKGSTAGVVVFAGDTVGSKLVESIESGDMPRGSGKVSPENLAKLKLWINQGARFDGPIPTASLRSLAPSSNSAASPAPEKNTMTRPNGAETVSFSRDVAPILTSTCNGCHYEGMRAQGGFQMNNFAQLLKGGDSGEAILPKKGADSLLIKKLRGMSGQRMPAGERPALSEDKIQLISTWIDEGARFDGDNQELRLEEVITKAWTSKATHDELMTKRVERAREQWKVVSPKTTPEEATDDRFLIIGNIGSESAKKLLAIANAAEAKTKKGLKISGKDPLLKGGITIFALKQRYDYSEFGKMLEKRELPADWSSHWRRGGLEAYVSIIFAPSGPDKNYDAIIESSLVQQMTSLWVSQWEGTPQWFAEGAGRWALVGAAGANDARLQAWAKRTPLAMNQLDTVKNFMDGKMNDEDAAIIGLAIIRAMNDGARKKQYDNLIRSMSNGASFDAAMSKTFGPVEPLLKTLLGRKK
jgi:mono/diheme cytochrome c family protein